MKYFRTIFIRKYQSVRGSLFYNGSTLARYEVFSLIFIDRKCFNENAGFVASIENVEMSKTFVFARAR